MDASMRMTDSAGKESGESNKGSFASQHDAATPRTAPAQEMTMGFDEAAGADRTADGEVMLAGAAPGQQKDGAVGAADDQQEHNASEKKRQGACSFLLVRHDDGLQSENASDRAPDALSQTGARWVPAQRWRRQV
jgi:hypothetical protein